MKKIKLFEEFVNEALNPTEFERAVKDLAYSMPNHTNYEDVPSEEQIINAMKKYQKDLYKHSTPAQKKEAVKKVVQILSESVKESYKSIPHNIKIAGKYDVSVGKYPTKQARVTIAGFERHGDDTDALYLDDSDSHKSLFGSFIVKNSDMFKLEKGKHITCKTSKGEDAEITRVGDL